MEMNSKSGSGDEDDIYEEEDDSAYVNSFFLPGGILDPQIGGENEDVEEEKHRRETGATLEETMMTTTSSSSSIRLLHFPPSASTALQSLPRSVSTASPTLLLESPLLESSSEHQLCISPWNIIAQQQQQQQQGSPHSSLRSTSFDVSTDSMNNNVSFVAAAAESNAATKLTAASANNSFDLSYGGEQHGGRIISPNRAQLPFPISRPNVLSLQSALLIPPPPPPPGFNNMLSSESSSFDSLLLLQNKNNLQPPCSSLLSAAPASFSIQQHPRPPPLYAPEQTASFELETETMFVASSSASTMQQQQEVPLQFFRKNESSLLAEQHQQRGTTTTTCAALLPTVADQSNNNNNTDSFWSSKITNNQTIKPLQVQEKSSFFARSFDNGNLDNSSGSFESCVSSSSSQHNSNNNINNIETTTTVCKFFAMGYCKFGKKCKFSHDIFGNQGTSSSIQQQQQHQHDSDEANMMMMGQQSCQSSSSSSLLGNAKKNSPFLHHDNDNVAKCSTSYLEVAAAASGMSASSRQSAAHYGLQQQSAIYQEAKDEKTATFLERVSHENKQYVVSDSPESTGVYQHDGRKGNHATERGTSSLVLSGNQQNGERSPDSSSSKSTPRLDSTALSPAKTVVANGDHVIPEKSTDPSEYGKQRRSTLPCESTADSRSLVRPVAWKQQQGDIIVQQQEKTTTTILGRKASSSSSSPSVPPSTVSNVRTSLSTKIVLPETVKAVWEAILALTFHVFEQIFGLCRGLALFCRGLVSNVFYFVKSVPFVLLLLTLGIFNMSINALEELWAGRPQKQQKQWTSNNGSNKRPALLFYDAMAFVPMFCDVLMNSLFSIRYLFLPQWAPHVISNAVIYWLCRDTSNKSNMRRREMQPVEISIQFLRRHLPLYFAVACFLMDGFGEENSWIMLLPLPKRLVIAYVLAIVDRGLLLSPVAWVSLALQVLLVYYFSSPSFYPLSVRSGSNVVTVTPTWASYLMFKETCVIVFVPILGLTSIRLLSILEGLTTQTMKSMQHHQQHQKSTTSTTTNRQTSGRKTGR